MKRRVFSCLFSLIALTAGIEMLSASDSKSVDGLADKYLKGAWGGNSRYAVPMLDKSEAPVIDGKIDEKEWRKSIEVAGFQDTKKGLIPGQRGFVYLTRDKENLYIAVRTSAPNNDPGCGLKSNAKERDGAVYSDDSVEVILNPDSEPETAYHLIVNPAGVIFDRKYTYSTGNDDLKWNFSNVKVVSLAESGYWNLEIKIPVNEIGDPSKFLKMNIARNWSEIGQSALISTANHLDRKNMFRLDWNMQNPAIRMTELGAPDEGVWKLRISGENFSKDRDFVVAAMLRKITWSTVDGKTQSAQSVEKVETQILPAGGNTNLSLDYDANKNVHYLTVVVFDPRSGEVIYSRFISGAKGAASGRHPATAKFEIPGLGDGQLFYYPGFNKAAVQINFASEKMIENVNVFAVDKNGNKTSATAVKMNRYYRALLQLNKDTGEYSFGIDVTAKGAKPEIIKNICKVEKRSFQWENNNLGKDKIIIPPFIPIKTDEGFVEVLDRKHKINPSGLWNSLVIKGKEQLAAPMRFECVINGKIQVLKGDRVSITTEDNGYAARIDSSVKSDGGIRIDNETCFEYDGFSWSKVKLFNIENKQIDRLTLVIPLKKEESPMFHVVSNTIRTNPAGNIPDGTGLVWDGTKLKRATEFGKEIIHPQLVPYIWIGGEANGLCWFLDSSYGYKLKRDSSAMRIVRDDKELRLEIDIINRPSMLKDGHAFEFGMQATPVKPIDKKLRSVVYDSSGEGIKGMNTAFPVHGNLLGYVYNWSKLPYRKDFSLFDNSLALLNGKTQNSIYSEWIKNNGDDIKNIISKVPASNGDNAEHYEMVRNNFYKFTFGKKKPVPSIIYKYSDPRLSFMLEDEADYFKSEWWSPQVQGYFGAYRIFPTPSALDFMIYSYAQELKHGLQGIYLDDTFIMPSDNPDTLARIDNEGELHACIGILAMRELVKRIAVMQHQSKCSPRLLIVHMTNAQIVPCFSFATSQLSWESMFGETPLQERYTLDAVRAVDTGLHVGMDPVALGGILRKTSTPEAWKTENARLSRTSLAMTLPHGVKIWYRWSPDDIYWPVVSKVYEKMSELGCWNDDSVFVPYWIKDSAIAASSRDIIISSYRRPGACMAIVANMKKEDIKTAVKIDTAKLGLRGKMKTIDAETGEDLLLSDILIKGYDFKIIYIGDVQ